LGRLARREIRAKQGRLETGVGEDTTVTRAKPARLETPVKPERPGTGVGQDGRETQVKRDGPVTRVCKVRPRRVQQESIATQTPIRDD
jgi:hypothetical protein